MGKQSSQAFKPHDVENFGRQQQRFNNPNQSNIFGSTTTTFGDDDQATIVQELSEPMQGIINSQMDFVGQGPAQLGRFSNPFMEGILNNTMGNIARTSGWGMSPDASQMGGFSGFNPQFNAQQQEMAQALNADPNQQINLETPPQMPMSEPNVATKPMHMENIKAGLQNAAQSYQPMQSGVMNKVKADPQQAEQLAQGLMQIFQSRKGG